MNSALDFTELVLNGYLDTVANKNLDSYFIRQFKIAEKERFYSPEEFFDYCTLVLSKFRTDLENQLNERRKDIYTRLNGARNKTLRYENDNRPIELAWQETISNCEAELKNISVSDFLVHLPSLTNLRYIGTLNIQDLQTIFEAIVKAKKEFLEQNNDDSDSHTEDFSQNRTKSSILEKFENMDIQGWKYAFKTEKDYILFTDLLTNFFEYKPYKLPETTIQLNRTCKTKVAKTLGEIHRKLSNENKLITDTKYFSLIRILSPFENVKERDLYKALTR